jgi:putative ABC transport system substrate-binding protein
MDRRQFLATAGLVALLPFAARAQGRPLRRAGIMTALQARADQIRQGLADAGWVEGVNLELIVRITGGDQALVATYADELVALAPDVLVTSATPPTVALARRTSTIPVVFAVVSDPVGSGLVDSLAHPGRNVTGFTNFLPSLSGKWLDMLLQVAPGLTRVGMIHNPTTSLGPYYLDPFLAAAATVGVTPVEIRIANAAEIDMAVAELGSVPGSGLIAMPDSFLNAQADRLTAAVLASGMPAIYSDPQFTRAGGLLSYGIDAVFQTRQTGQYAGRVLDGDLPAELPVQGPTVFQTVINLRTARAQGIDIPATLLTLADEVIE